MASRLVSAPTNLVINLEVLLTKKPADRPKWLKENADCEVTGKAIEVGGLCG